MRLRIDACVMMGRSAQGLGEASGLRAGVMEKTQQSQTVPSTRRRSARILLRVPLLVNQADRNPDQDWESVETVMVSRNGGLIRTQRTFQVGATLEIRKRTKDRTARARVVWTSAEITPVGIELGFEILDDSGFWEINFPEDVWSSRTPPGKG